MKETTMQSYDHLPRHDPTAVPFTAENCEGYTQYEMQALNVEFIQRWNHAGDWLSMSQDAAMKAFQEEVSCR
jgi:hypothetical protein